MTESATRSARGLGSAPGARDVLGAATAMGAVTLRVADLDGMTDFYRDGALLQVLEAVGGTVVLGRLGTPIVVLEHAPELRHASPRDAGLFHVAILYPGPAELAAAVYSVARAHPSTFTGSADHLVSEAFYFTDPEGNGVELYHDRARTDWRWEGGRVRMDTLRLDPNAFLAAHLSEAALAHPDQHAATVGHVHLAVGDVPTAREFYVDRLGFEITADLRSALFVSAGGYHHHVAMNVWNSAGAGRRGHTLGLGLMRVEVADADELGALGERLRAASIAVDDDGRMLGIDDPWGNRVEVRVRG